MSKDNNDNWRNQSNINNPSQLPVNKPAIPELPSSLSLNKPPFTNQPLSHFGYQQPPTYP